MLKLQNITKKDLMVATPDGAGITVKPLEYIEGDYFSGLPANQWKEITNTTGLKKVYTATLSSGESSTIFSHDSENNIIQPDLFNSTVLPLSSGQIHYVADTGTFNGIVPTNIYVSYPFPNNVLIKFDFQDNSAVVLEEDTDYYDGPGYRYYLKNALFNYNGLPGQFMSFDNVYPDLKLDTFKLFSREEGTETTVNLITNGTFDTNLSGWRGALIDDPPTGWEWSEDGALNPSGGTLDELVQMNKYTDESIIGLNAVFTIKAIMPADPGFTVNVFDSANSLICILDQNTQEFTGPVEVRSGGDFGGSRFGVRISPQDSNEALTITEVSAMLTYTPTVVVNATRRNVIDKGLILSNPLFPNATPTYYITLNRIVDPDNEEYWVECYPKEDELIFAAYTYDDNFRFKDSTGRLTPTEIEQT